MEGSAIPNGGKPVGYDKGGRLTGEAELAMNERFARAFALNYPIVFAAPEVNGSQYHTFAIPAAFVVDRRGRVSGIVTGLRHERLVELVEKALAEPMESTEPAEPAKPADPPEVPASGK